jgi:hypothetical protein
VLQFFDGRDQRPINLMDADTFEGALDDTGELRVRLVGRPGTRFRFAELGLTLATERERWLES